MVLCWLPVVQTRSSRISPEFAGFHQNLPGFTRICRISPEFAGFHENLPDFTRISPKIHQNFARIANWSILKRGITTTQPSHTMCPRFPGSGPRKTEIVCRKTGCTADSHYPVITVNPQTKNLDFRGFDWSRFLIPRGGIPRSIGNLPEIIRHRSHVEMSN